MPDYHHYAGSGDDGDDDDDDDDDDTEYHILTVISRRSMQATSLSAPGHPRPPGFTFY